MTTERIEELNDMLRKTFFVGGRVVTTPGIRALPEADQSAIREKVETFNGEARCDLEPRSSRTCCNYARTALAVTVRA